MLIANAKLKVPYGTLSNILEIGDYYALGSQLLRKDLRAQSPDKAFQFPTLASGDDGLNVWLRSSMGPNGIPLQSLLGLSGSCANLNGSQGTGTDVNTTPSSAANLCESLPTFLDSTLGSTAGKRLVAYCNGLGTALSCATIGSSGEATWLSSISYSLTGDAKCYALGESALCAYWLVVSMSLQPTSYNGFSRIVQFNKVTGVSTIISTTSGNLNSIGYVLRPLGRTDDNKVWLASVSNNPVSSTAQAQLIVLNLATDTLQYSVFMKLNAGAPNSNYSGCVQPSQLSICANDPTKYKMYWPIDPDANPNGTLQLKLSYVPKAGSNIVAASLGAWPMVSVAMNVPPPVHYAAAPTGAWAGAVDMWTFNASGKEYLAIAYHPINDQSYNAVNKVTLDRQAIHVYLIDPADPTNLTYKGTTSDNGYGAGRLFGSLVKSVDGRTVAVGSSWGFVVLGFNTTLEKFVAGPSTPIPAVRMALDTQNQLWIEDYTRNLYVFNPQVGSNIVVTYDVPEATFSGSPVTANAIVNCFDFFGVRQAATVNLNVAGAVFTDTNSTSASCVTSTVGDTLVPLTITAAGGVTVTPVV